MLFLTPTFKKIKVLYWHLWFHEEHLTSMQPFHCTKASLQWKKSDLDNLNVLHTKKKTVIFLHERLLYGIKTHLWHLYLEDYDVSFFCIEH